MPDTDLKALEDRVARLEIAIGGIRYPGPIGGDPAGPWGGGYGGGYLPVYYRPPIGDPPPTDFSRFSTAQLQSSLHSITAERTRLDALEQSIKAQLKKQQA